MNKWNIMLVIGLWLLPVSVWFFLSLPAWLRDAFCRLRVHGHATPFVLCLLLIALAVYGGTKTPPDPPPPGAPAALSGRINLYYFDADGLMIPLNAAIRRVMP